MSVCSGPGAVYPGKLVAARLRSVAAGLYAVFEAWAWRLYGRRFEDLAPEEVMEVVSNAVGDACMVRRVLVALGSEAG